MCEFRFICVKAKVEEWKDMAITWYAWDRTCRPAAGACSKTPTKIGTDGNIDSKLPGMRGIVLAGRPAGACSKTPTKIGTDRDIVSKLQDFMNFSMDASFKIEDIERSRWTVGRLH
jgi:hypothetical protein